MERIRYIGNNDAQDKWNNYKQNMDIYHATILKNLNSFL